MPMEEGDAPVVIDSKVSGTSDRVPAGRIGWDVRGSGSCATAWVAGGEWWRWAARSTLEPRSLIPDCYVAGGLRGRGEGSDGG